MQFRTLSLQLILLAGLHAAQVPTEAPANPAMETIVREYLLQHPAFFLDLARQFLTREQTALKERSKEAVSAKIKDLQQDPSSPVTGPAEGVTIVEFFDYRCAFCKRAESTIANLLAKHPEIRLVFKELPILGPESLLAAKAGLAAYKQGGYLRFHEGLMILSGTITMDAIRELAIKQGLNVSVLALDMESVEVKSTLERNSELAHKVGVNATPTFIIGKEVVQGAVNEAALDKLISQARINRVQGAGLNSEKE